MLYGGSSISDSIQKFMLFSRIFTAVGVARAAAAASAGEAPADEPESTSLLTPARAIEPGGGAVAALPGFSSASSSTAARNLFFLPHTRCQHRDKKDRLLFLL